MGRGMGALALSCMVSLCAAGWDGAVVLDQGALQWGQYKEMKGVAGVPVVAREEPASVMAVCAGAGASAGVIRAQAPGQAFFSPDGSAISETERARMQTALDAVNRFDMLPIVILFDPDALCKLANAEAYEKAAALFQQTFTKANWFLPCVTDRSDDPGWPDGAVLCQRAGAAIHGVAPKQLVAAGASKPEANEALMKDGSQVAVIVARVAKPSEPSASLKAPCIEVLDAAALTDDILATLVRRSDQDRFYGWCASLDMDDSATRTAFLARLIDAVDVYQRAAYPSSPINPADTFSLKPGEKEEGFVSLFNGKDLAGWLPLTKPGDFEVREGAIQLMQKTGGWLRSWKRYGDFVLRIEFRIESGGNSGIYIRTSPGGRNSRIGFETQVFGDPARRTPIKDSCAAIYDVRPPDGHFMKPGLWNEYEIMCQGDTVRVKWNGHVVHDFRYGDIEALKHRCRKGFIGLQDHESKVEFRNIRIKELS